VSFQPDGMGRIAPVTRRSGRELLALRLRLHRIQLGQPADLLLDREMLRVVGLDIACGDGAHRYLPLPVAVVEDGGISISSPLVLLEEDELAFYRARTFAYSSLRGRPVEVGGVAAGKLVDIVIGPGGDLVEVIVNDDNGRTRPIPFGDSVRFAPASRSAA
jgi:PRC-barrel domain